MVERPFSPPAKFWPVVGGGERVLNVAMLNDYAYVVNSLWEHPVCFPFENQEPSSRPGTEWVLEKKYLLNQTE